ncbi:hypothetical protein BCR44DRAFT_395162 [Catenaria anguillulae PL171]|uniref:Pore membrane protein of 33 kDa n=1 Tax=Catenaria anguillulae PL171 TaxID=765915 RepID=A0A1Y2HAX9_9FUNG|nr:hypothetical protein BCR44DRAFT_395162 [Catenaria anguillulae PL171]
MSLPLSQRLLRLAKHPQAAWAFGHLLTAIGLPLYMLFGSVGAYSRALLGAMLAYGVVLYRHYKPSVLQQGLAPTARRMLHDLNAHYFALALYFWMSGYPCVALLVPYASFSLFHCIGYMHSILLPAIFPPATNPAPAIVSGLSAKASAFSATYQPQALQVASYWEITVTPLYLVMQVLLWRQALLAPLVYAQFMAVRYLTSATTRSASANVRRILDSKFEPLAARPDALGSVGSVYIAIRNRIVGYLDARMSAAAPAPAPAAGAGAQ